jgi:hypothetical protein
MASKASLARLQRVLRQINFPSSVGNRINEMVDNPGGLLSSDYVRLAGPLGVFIIDQLDIDVQYKQVFCASSWPSTISGATAPSQRLWTAWRPRCPISWLC